MKELLIACGADVASSTSLWARDMTPDGKTIVGSINYGPRYHAFKAALSRAGLLEQRLFVLIREDGLIGSIP